jgi:hypothetical protein
MLIPRGQKKRGAEAPQSEATEALFTYIECGGEEKVVLTNKIPDLE